MRIAVIGTGGIGAFFGAKLIEAGMEVHFLATERHVEPVRQSGMRLSTAAGENAWRPASITSDAREIGPVDLVLVTVKLYQLQEATADIEALLGPDTRVLTMQNGISAPRILAEQIGDERVVSAIAFIISFLEEPGHVRQLGNRAGFTASTTTRSGAPAALVADLVETLVGVGVDARASDQIDRELWRKFSLITTFGGVCGLADSALGPVREFGPTRALLEQSLTEARAVAVAVGVGLTKEDSDGILARMDLSDPGATTSMQRDIAAGRPSELEYLNGELVRLAGENGVDVPLQRAAVAVLRLRERKNRGV